MGKRAFSDSLLGQHDPIVVGETREDTLRRTVTLEEAAKTYSISKKLFIAVPEGAIITEYGTAQDGKGYNSLICQSCSG